MWDLVPRAVRERIVRAKVRKALLEFLRGAGIPDQVAEKWTEGIMGNLYTWAAGIGSIATGVGIVANEIATKAYRFDEILKGVAAIGAGLTIIGHGNAHEATKAAIEENTRAVVNAGEVTAQATREAVRGLDRPIELRIDGKAIATANKAGK